MRIYLTGFMGAGKTSVGKLLAERTEREFVDLDERIEERAGRGIPEIFETEGEAWFRELEHLVLRSVDAARVVVATGGGTAAFEGNRRWMSRSGIVVWLNADLDTILDRIGPFGRPDRPLFRSEEQVLDLYRARLPAYRRADLEIRVESGETPAEVAARIRLLLSEGSCGI